MSQTVSHYQRDSGFFRMENDAAEEPTAHLEWRPDGDSFNQRSGEQRRDVLTERLNKHGGHV